MDCQDHRSLLRMAIADALQMLKKDHLPIGNQYYETSVKAAIDILEDALADKYSEENLEIIFPNDFAAVGESDGDISSGGGYIELKMIPRNGKMYGPYAYWRYRQGGRLRSKYIGKAEDIIKSHE